MKRLVKLEDVEECIKNGLLSASEIAKELNYDCSVIYSFCKRHNINLIKLRCGGKNVVDLSGQTINHLKVIKRNGSIRDLATWECECPCGKIFTAIGSDIRSNKTKTCGCQISLENRKNWQGYGNIPKRYWSTINNGAKQRNLEFSVLIEELDELFIKQNKRCKLTNIELIFTSKSSSTTASLDRIDNNKGYIKDNLQWIHKDVNFMKQDLDNSYFIEMCRLISINNKDKK